MKEFKSKGISLENMVGSDPGNFHDQCNPAPSNPVTFLYGVITDFTESKFYDSKNSIVVVHNSSSFAL